MTFHTTAEAMAAEKILKQYNIAGRLIPVPRQISSGCGLAWSAQPGESDRIKEIAEARELGFEAMGEYLI